MTLHETVSRLMAQGKGILAADESTATATKRLEAVGVESTEDTRRAYREMLFTAPGAEKYLSGVILYDETLRQTASNGMSMPDLLSSRGISVGIKVDQGLEEDPNNSNGKLTKGLEGLGERLKEYKSFGAVFTKWRSVAVVGDGFGDATLRENASRMAEYARICHENGFVPIVEPEVLIDGGHTAEQCENALIDTLSVTFDSLESKGVDVAGVILKTSMAVTGKENPLKASSREVGERTARALKASVPDKVGGVVFLSGGQSPEEATANLNEISKQEPLPWPITFSFARALQDPALSAWKGSPDNVPVAQAALVRRLSLNVLADAGGYSKEMEGV